MTDKESTSAKPAGNKMLDRFVELEPQRRLLGILDEVYANSYGVCVITGPRGSGRRRLLNAFANRLRPDTAAAVIEGSERSSQNMLSSVLSQFGYDFSSTVLNEMSGMLRVFSVHQTQSGCRPFVGVLATDQMNDELRDTIGALAAIDTGRESALSFVFCGDKPAAELLADPVLEPLLKRVCLQLEMEPMSAAALATYLREKYHADISDERLIEDFRRYTEGLPGRIDALLHNVVSGGAKLSATALRAALAVAGDSSAPDSGTIEILVAKLMISQSGQLVGEQVVDDKRMLIGRAAHNDVILESRYISRHHAFLIRGSDGSDWLVDLNSRNGTFVNSRSVDYWPLRHNDVISMGNHRLKYVNPAATSPRPPKSDFAENTTAVFEAIGDDGEVLSLVEKQKTESG